MYTQLYTVCKCVLLLNVPLIKDLYNSFEPKVSLTVLKVIACHNVICRNFGFHNYTDNSLVIIIVDEKGIFF